MYYLESQSTDPGWNLAVEEYLADNLKKGESCLFLWQNDNTIVVGKNQNTVAQINETFVREKGIRVRRRLSGGGAVYHDLGNLCFTWITDAGEEKRIDFSAFCTPVMAAMAALGVEAELSGRNDIVARGRKLSGNAQYFHRGKVVHHGTILIESDLTVLSRSLRVDKTKIRDKGIDSVASRVANLRELAPERITVSGFRQALKARVFENIPMEPLALTEEALEQIRSLQRERYDTWQWNYGRSPAYSRRECGRIPGCGTVEVYTDIDQGRIQKIRILGDYFENRDVGELEARMEGCQAQRSRVLERLCSIGAERYIRGADASALADLIAPV